MLKNHEVCGTKHDIPPVVCFSKPTNKVTPSDRWFLTYADRSRVGFARKLAFRLGLGICSALQLPANCIFLLCNPEKCLIPPGMGFAKLMPKLTFRARLLFAPCPGHFSPIAILQDSLHYSYARHPAALISSLKHGHWPVLVGQKAKKSV